MDSDNYTCADFLELDDSDLFAKAQAFAPFYSDWNAKGTCSYHRLLTSRCTNRATIRDRLTGHDREFIVLASNNYLGLNNHPEVVAAAQQAMAKYGSGMCGSRFLSGTYDLVEELEAELADFEHCEAAMFFTSGYQANVGAISALLRSHDIAFIDRLSHASIVDGCRMSGSTTRTFRHNDVDHLERLLKKNAGKEAGKLIVVDGVFSMDGDLAPLPEILALAKQYGAKLIVDEAHGTGVVGPTGGGSVEHFGLHGEIDIILGTCSKTLASTGGFICGTKAVVDYVRYYGRSYMFSASATPGVVAGVLAALRIIRREPQIREKLWENIRYFHAGLTKCGLVPFPDPPESAIITVEIGADKTVRDMSKRIYEEGLFVSAVQYPAVSRDHGKLRLSLSSLLTREDLDAALEILQRVGAEFGVLGRTTI
jgi:8-amino-7-oxononanoate synthase